MIKHRVTNKVEHELASAIRKNREAVDKLKKFELRQWESKTLAQQEVCRLARVRLYSAWDAYRVFFIEKDGPEEA